MPVDYRKLGDNIRSFRRKKNYSQETLAEKTDLSRENINRFENATKKPGLDALISIATALHVSVDDLLVDSIGYTNSTADSSLHQVLLTCNKVEEEILTQNAMELKKILSSLGI